MAPAWTCKSCQVVSRKAPRESSKKLVENQVEDIGLAVNDLRVRSQHLRSSTLYVREKGQRGPRHAIRRARVRTWTSPMTEKLRFCETRPVFLLTLPRLSLSVKSVGVAFCVPNGFFMSQMGLSTILKREGCNRGDTLPFSDTLVAPLPIPVSYPN